MVTRYNAITTNDRPVRFEDYSPDRPDNKRFPIVVLMGGCRERTEECAPAASLLLKGGYRTLVVDTPASNCSSIRDPIGARTQNMTTVVEQISGDNEIILAGHSLGGVVAARTALNLLNTGSSKVGAVVLLEPAGLSHKRLGSGLVQTMGNGIHELAEAAFHPFVSTHLASIAFRRTVTTSPAGFWHDASEVCAGLTADISDNIVELQQKVPVVISVDEHDSVVPPILPEGYGNNVVVQRHSGGHMATYYRPGTVLSAVRVAHSLIRF